MLPTMENAQMKKNGWLGRWNNRSFLQMKFVELGKPILSKPHIKYFPFETHTWVPFANLLSHNKADKLLKFKNKYWLSKHRDANWLLLGKK